MPIYEYQCKQCHKRTERIQKFSDPPLTVCPKCGGELEQLLSAPAIQFKGSGWYVTDYSRSGKSEAGGSNGPKAKSESGEATPAETKTEAAKTESPSTTKTDSSSSK